MTVMRAIRRLFGKRGHRWRARMLYQRATRGWSDRDVWNFDTYLAGVIAGGAAQLAARAHGHPCDMDADGWDRILKQIAYDFQRYADADGWNAPPVRKGTWKLLRDNFGDLWD